MMKTCETGKSFAPDYHFFKMFWVFLASSVAGCLIETGYAYLRHGDFESRVGLIYGPFSQIYGFAAVIMILILHRIGVKSWLCLFFSSALIGASFEFLSSLIQEHVFGSVSWDYSNHPLNIFGRTSLEYAVFWGLLGAFLIRVFYPLLSGAIEKLPCRFGLVITWLLIVFMAADMLLSSAAVMREHERHHNIAATNSIQRILDHYYPDSFIKAKYPNMLHV